MVTIMTVATPNAYALTLSSQSRRRDGDAQIRKGLEAEDDGDDGDHEQQVDNRDVDGARILVRDVLDLERRQTPRGDELLHDGERGHDQALRGDDGREDREHEGDPVERLIRPARDRVPEDGLLKRDVRARADEPRALAEIGEREAGQDEAEARDLDGRVGELLRRSAGRLARAAYAEVGEERLDTAASAGSRPKATHPVTARMTPDRRS